MASTAAGVAHPLTGYYCPIPVTVAVPVSSFVSFAVIVALRLPVAVGLKVIVVAYLEAPESVELQLVAATAANSVVAVPFSVTAKVNPGAELQLPSLKIVLPGGASLDACAL